MNLYKRTMHSTTLFTHKLTQLTTFTQLAADFTYNTIYIQQTIRITQYTYNTIPMSKK